MSAFATLRSLTRTPRTNERCDMCGTGVLHQHQHLIDPVSRRLVCTCDACAVLFYQGGEKKYKRVPRRVRFLADFQMTDAQWDSLLIPIGLAFFLENSPENRVLALYPSPAGSTESMLSLEAWGDIVQENPALAEMEPDVEALLVNRLDRAGEYYVAPIDKCYQLVGLIRSNWRGLSGGTEVWEKIRDFFVELKAVSNA
jgi:Family of unknown function (DUF5947)